MAASSFVDAMLPFNDSDKSRPGSFMWMMSSSYDVQPKPSLGACYSRTERHGGQEMARWCLLGRNDRPPRFGWATRSVNKGQPLGASVKHIVNVEAVVAA